MTTSSTLPKSKEPVRRHGAAIGLFTLIKVLLILAVWAAGFIAFLTAPLLVLAIAAAIGFGWLALRRTKQEEAVQATTPRPGPRSHQFGADRGQATLATPTADATLATPSTDATLATPSTDGTLATPTADATLATPTADATLATPTVTEGARS